MNIQLKKGDIVSFPGSFRGRVRGRYDGMRTKDRATVSVSGGPPCDVLARNIWLVARPKDNGFDVYLNNEVVGFAKDRKSINEIRAEARKQS